MNQSIIIKSTGETIYRDEEGAPSLEFLQEAVGGYIQMIPWFDRIEGKPCVAYCNEEGKLKGLPVNSIATIIWRAQNKPHLEDLLVGDIVVLTGDGAFMDSL